MLQAKDRIPFISHFQQGRPRASGLRPQGSARLAALGQPHYCYENIDGGHSAAANLTGYARRLATRIHLCIQGARGLSAVDE